MKNPMIESSNIFRYGVIGLVISFAAVATGAVLLGHGSVTTQAQGSGSEFECSNATLRGSYSFTSQGWVPGGPPGSSLVPFATANRMSLDGIGGIVNDTTVSRNGEIGRNVGKGSYSVGKNCKGKMTFDAPPGLPFKLEFDIVVTHKGEGFDSINTNGGAVVRSEGKRIHHGL